MLINVYWLISTCAELSSVFQTTLLVKGLNLTKVNLDLVVFYCWLLAETVNQIFICDLIHKLDEGCRRDRFVWISGNLLA